MGHIPTVIKIAPMLLVHTAVQIAFHFVFTMSVGKLFKIPFRELVLASNANVGGPTTGNILLLLLLLLFVISVIYNSIKYDDNCNNINNHYKYNKSISDGFKQKVEIISITCFTNWCFWICNSHSSRNYYV